MSRIKSFTDDDDGAVSSASVELEYVCDTPTVVKSDSELLRQARTIDEEAQPAYVLFLLSTSSVLGRPTLVGKALDFTHEFPFLSFFIRSPDR